MDDEGCCAIDLNNVGFLWFILIRLYELFTLGSDAVLLTNDTDLSLFSGAFFKGFGLLVKRKALNLYFLSDCVNSYFLSFLADILPTLDEKFLFETKN